AELARTLYTPLYLSSAPSPTTETAPSSTQSPLADPCRRPLPPTRTSSVISRHVDPAPEEHTPVDASSGPLVTERVQREVLGTVSESETKKCCELPSCGTKRRARNNAVQVSAAEDSTMKIAGAGQGTASGNGKVCSTAGNAASRPEGGQSAHLQAEDRHRTDSVQDRGAVGGVPDSVRNPCSEEYSAKPLQRERYRVAGAERHTAARTDSPLMLENEHHHEQLLLGVHGNEHYLEGETERPLLQHASRSLVGGNLHCREESDEEDSPRESSSYVRVRRWTWAEGGPRVVSDLEAAIFVLRTPWDDNDNLQAFVQGQIPLEDARGFDRHNTGQHHAVSESGAVARPPCCDVLAYASSLQSSSSEPGVQRMRRCSETGELVRETAVQRNSSDEHTYGACSIAEMNSRLDACFQHTMPADGKRDNASVVDKTRRKATSFSLSRQPAVVGAQPRASSPAQAMTFTTNLLHRATSTRSDQRGTADSNQRLLQQKGRDSLGRESLPKREHRDCHRHTRENEDCYFASLGEAAQHGVQTISRNGQAGNGKEQPAKTNNQSLPSASSSVTTDCQGAEGGAPPFVPAEAGAAVCRSGGAIPKSYKQVNAEACPVREERVADIPEDDSDSDETPSCSCSEKGYDTSFDVSGDPESPREWEMYPDPVYLPPPDVQLPHGADVVSVVAGNLEILPDCEYSPDMDTYYAFRRDTRTNSGTIPMSSPKRSKVSGVKWWGLRS
ncbi:hypothetical protein BaRGS_00003495, partial [Batillaria attramentaria]